MKRFAALAVVAACCSLGLQSAQATKIESQFTQLAGPTWTVEFTVTNDGTVPSVGEFTVFFDETLYSNLSVIASPLTWDSIAIQPDPGIPATGYFDSLVLYPEFALGKSQGQGGFKAGFTFLGGGKPDALPFSVVDGNFQTIESGVTLATLPSLVPEVGTMALFGFGLAYLGFAGAIRIRTKSRTASPEN